MHPNPNGQETIRERLERDRRAIDELLRSDVVLSDEALVLEQLPNGEHAWLRPETEDVRYVLTAKGPRGDRVVTDR